MVDRPEELSAEELARKCLEPSSLFVDVDPRTHPSSGILSRF
jgi:hypothetical protein